MENKLKDKQGDLLLNDKTNLYDSNRKFANEYFSDFTELDSQEVLYDNQGELGISADNTKDVFNKISYQHRNLHCSVGERDEISKSEYTGIKMNRGEFFNPKRKIGTTRSADFNPRNFSQVSRNADKNIQKENPDKKQLIR